MATARVEARRAATRAAILEAAWGIARENGLAGIGMRELAAELDLAASSLYGYFNGKDAIYDAMFIDGNASLARRFADVPVDQGKRKSLIAGALAFIEFCDEDHARFQLLFQHSIPGWEPSAEAYASAQENFEQMRSYLAELGITDNDSIDLWTALTSGLASQQVANDPGGDRWKRLVERSIDMYLSTGREQR